MSGHIASRTLEMWNNAKFCHHQMQTGWERRKRGADRACSFITLICTPTASDRGNNEREPGGGGLLGTRM